MKVNIWPEDLSALEMSDWIARLRDQASGETPGDGATEPEPAQPASPVGRSLTSAEIAARVEDVGWAVTGAPVESEGWAVTGAPVESEGRAVTGAPVETAGRAVTGAPVESAGRAVTGAPVESAGRAVIGDQLRKPIAWCELGSCISHHTDPAALGESDIRARALSAGWRFDRLGRLACLECQQRDPWFWPTHQVVPWDRRAAITRVALMTAYTSEEGFGGGAAGAQRAVIPAAAPAAISTAGNWIRGRHRKQP